MRDPKNSPIVVIFAFIFAFGLIGYGVYQTSRAAEATSAPEITDALITQVEGPRCEQKRRVTTCSSLISARDADDPSAQPIKAHDREYIGLKAAHAAAARYAPGQPLQLHTLHIDYDGKRHLTPAAFKQIAADGRLLSVNLLYIGLGLVLLIAMTLTLIQRRDELTAPRES